MDRKTKSEERIKEVLGDNAPEIIRDFEKISPDFAKYVIEFAYGDIYAREGLTDKMRELAVIGCLIGQGNTGTALRAHFGGMLNVGWKKHEIIEVIILLIGYAGFPTAVDALQILEEVAL